MARDELPHNPYNMGSGGVWREGGRVHKVLTPKGRGLPHWATSDNPRFWNYWRREAYVYETAQPARLGLGAPELYELREHADGAVELVLEDVSGRHAATLTLEDLVATARALGRAQGAAELPAEPWLSRAYLRTYTTTRAVDYALLDDDAAWALPALREHFPPALRDGLRRLHANRYILLGLAEAAPRTLAHLDVWPNNIIMREDRTPVLIDWQFTGAGAVGEDVANLIPDAVFDLQFDHTLLPELADGAIEAYINGLRDAGWSGRDDAVRLAIAACAVKYQWLFHYILQDARESSDGRAQAYGGVDVALDELLAARASGLALLVGWADEALRAAP
jgi:hypothetical protein